MSCTCEESCFYCRQGNSVLLHSDMFRIFLWLTFSFIWFLPGAFAQSKAPTVWNRSFTSIYCQGKEWVDIYLHFSIHFLGLRRNIFTFYEEVYINQTQMPLSADSRLLWKVSTLLRNLTAWRCRRHWYLEYDYLKTTKELRNNKGRERKKYIYILLV
jgi:hypothetical protein